LQGIQNQLFAKNTSACGESLRHIKRRAKVWQVILATKQQKGGENAQ
jgi:hypothetical protein